jgi:hypothetical protein
MFLSLKRANGIVDQACARSFDLHLQRLKMMLYEYCMKAKSGFTFSHLLIWKFMPKI